MTARNDHTGKTMTTGAASDAYRSGYDAIGWGAKREPVPACFGAYYTGNTNPEKDCDGCQKREACKREQR